MLTMRVGRQEIFVVLNFYGLAKSIIIYNFHGTNVRGLDMKAVKYLIFVERHLQNPQKFVSHKNFLRYATTTYNISVVSL